MFIGNFGQPHGQLTFSMRDRVWKYNVNLLQSSTFTQSDVVRKKVKRNKAIHHFVSKKTYDPHVPVLVFSSRTQSELLLKIKFRQW